MKITSRILSVILGLAMIAGSAVAVSANDDGAPIAPCRIPHRSWNTPINPIAPPVQAIVAASAIPAHKRQRAVAFPENNSPPRNDSMD